MNIEWSAARVQSLSRRQTIDDTLLPRSYVLFCCEDFWRDSTQTGLIWMKLWTCRVYFLSLWWRHSCRDRAVRQMFFEGMDEVSVVVHRGGVNDIHTWFVSFSTKYQVLLFGQILIVLISLRNRKTQNLIAMFIFTDGCHGYVRCCYLFLQMTIMTGRKTSTFNNVIQCYSWTINFSTENVPLRSNI